MRKKSPCSSAVSASPKCAVRVDVTVVVAGGCGGWWRRCGACLGPDQGIFILKLQRITVVKVALKGIAEVLLIRTGPYKWVVDRTGYERPNPVPAARRPERGRIAATILSPPFLLWPRGRPRADGGNHPQERHAVTPRPP